MKNPTYPKNNKKHSIKTRFTYRFLRTLNTSRTIIPRSSISITRRSREIKNAANMCMAATVGSKRAWSRAMLSKIHTTRKTGISYHARSSCVHKVNNEDEICELREIVPGGEDLDSKSLLEETAHYIKCLATQVQVMKDILHLYSSHD